MATDEELEAAFGMPRPTRLHQITEDEWCELTRAIRRVDRRVGRFGHLIVTATALFAAWFAYGAAIKHTGEGWAFAVAVVAFLIVGVIGQRDLERDG